MLDLEELMKKADSVKNAPLENFVKTYSALYSPEDFWKIVALLSRYFAED